MHDQKEIAKVEAGAGNFGECLVEGSAEDKKRGRKIKRLAIAVSIVLQSLGLTALVIAPMLAKPAEIKMTNTMPIPPFRHYAERQHIGDRQPVRPIARATTIFLPTVVPPRIVTRDPIAPPDEPPGFNEPSTSPGGSHIPDGLVPLVDTRSHVVVPPPPREKRVAVGHIDPALLVRRVEPVYPTIPKQLHRSGKVELHAVIAADGTIQSLQVVSGDPLFIDSALTAVREWRYKPTLLSGQPVEVDTFITVIYTLNQQ